jgi:dTDP-4-amino-4,6-dideoxygalactose transaminase
MIKLSKSIVGEKELNAVSKIILEDGYLGMGNEVEKFEIEIANYLNIQPINVVCVNTGTSALQLSLEAVIQKGDEVLVPSLTFLSSFQAITAAGGIPIACEVYANSLTIDLEDALKKITNKTKVIMPVHYASNPYKLNQVYNFAKHFNLRVIEDAAHAFGCFYNNQKIGSFGDIVCFSFDGIKNITSGEGGAIIAFKDEELQFLKDARLLSIEKDSEKRYKGTRSWDFDVKKQGHRFHLSNIFAAIGRIQLSRLDSEFAPKRKLLSKTYNINLNSNPNLILQEIDPNSDIIPHIFVIRVLNGLRDALKIELERNKIPTGIHYKPNHLLTLFGSGKDKLPTTEKIYSEILTLPLHPGITIKEVESICNLINNYLK